MIARQRHASGRHNATTRSSASSTCRPCVRVRRQRRRWRRWCCGCSGQGHCICICIASHAPYRHYGQWAYSCEVHPTQQQLVISCLVATLAATGTITAADARTSGGFCVAEPAGQRQACRLQRPRAHSQRHREQCRTGACACARSPSTTATAACSSERNPQCCGRRSGEAALFNCCSHCRRAWHAHRHQH